MSSISTEDAVVARLNRDCFCVTLDQSALNDALDREAEDPDFHAELMRTHAHLFASAPVFLARHAADEMLRVVHAIEAATRLPGYRETVLSRAPAIAHAHFGPRGAFMGYDFHLTPAGPRLIEINTNAGGGFLNALLAKAQHACCAEVADALGHPGAVDFETAVLRMFLREWALQGRSGAPQRVAIVDDRPEEQYLYPEFVLAQHFFRKHGIEAVIADAAALRYDGGRLLANGKPIDLVYNRLTDFVLEAPAHDALHAAYLDQAAVVTPSPWAYTLFADKRNLTLLSDPETLRDWGLAAEHIAALTAVPRTRSVTAEDADRLWSERKKLFFKPAVGYGSKAVYRGDRMTRRVWSEIAHGRYGDYVAQELVLPSERMVEIDGAPEPRKVDVRLYVYDGEILLTAARLYRGQATNFRTPGSGFAPVFLV
ncbi:MAG TPA: hypothetical protein VMW18_12310 [Candidatus Binatia bacterium]|nr:hypothetical protein [Candidatus Binatia bacterium]